jgi:O-antigen ligase
MMHRLRLGIAPAYLLLALLLGGASAAGFWANMILQLLAIPIIFWAVVAERATPASSPSRQLIVLLLLMLAVIAVQLVPLPPSVWTSLPGRGEAAEGFRMLGQPLPWMPISLAAHRTWSSALWLLPAIATLLAVIRLGGFKAQYLAWVLAIVTIASVGIGALQITGGEGSGWYLYRITNVGVTTGFFSNANHMATLLVCTVPFLAALYLDARAKGRSAQRASGMFVVLAGTLVVVFFGISVNRSVAGIALSIPVLAASALMITSRRRKLPMWLYGLVALLMLGAAAFAFTAPFGNTLAGEEARASKQSRATSFTRTLDFTGDYLPFGSGIGTFGEIYPSHEKSAEVTRYYMNHVHGDYIEVALETGLPGLVLILLFLVWWLRRAFAIWRTDTPDYFARAATIASAAILAHSLVDYPLRTAAISAVLAMCCALMAEPRPKVRRSQAPAAPEKQARHLSAD